MEFQLVTAALQWLLLLNPPFKPLPYSPNHPEYICNIYNIEASTGVFDLNLRLYRKNPQRAAAQQPENQKILRELVNRRKFLVSQGV